ncbi:hypothetical protein SEA_LILMARTIN_96 [Streptomyces phage LilMartin]|nr:hypothetical protein SEA_LILMARTIN_96 [Streptomyces phage LilMartin]
MNYEAMIDGHNALREKCLKLAKKNPKEYLGEYAWLQGAIQESDISLEFLESGISCYGYAYTTQTCCSEWFQFTIPLEKLGE